MHSRWSSIKLCIVMFGLSIRVTVESIVMVRGLGLAYVQIVVLN